MKSRFSYFLISIILFNFITKGEVSLFAESFAAPTTQQVEQQIITLRDEIAQHDYRYYQLHDPLISDTEYDALLERLQALETAFPEFASNASPTKYAGYPLAAEGQGVEHRVPMLGLDATRDVADLRAFDERCRAVLEIDGALQYVVELKYDGLAVELNYINGTFTVGSTRGDGTFGERVTENILAIQGFPRHLQTDATYPYPDDVDIRGEVYMAKTQFAQLNRARTARGQPAFANPRNAAAGSLRMNDVAASSQRGLGFFCYGWGYAEDAGGHSYATQWEVLEAMAAWGLPVHAERKVCKNIDAVIAYCQQMSAIRDMLDIEIDGVVIKVNRLDYQQRLGFAPTNPNWAIAYKFSPREAVTRVNDIIVQVGRTGLLTPVALLQPVNIGGATIRRASLHNFAELAQKDIRIGDTVLVCRAGDVIPEIVKVLPSYRDGSESVFSQPIQCPACSSALAQPSAGVALHCPSVQCPDQQVKRIAHFAAKDAMNIQGLGGKTAEQLVNAGLVTNPADLYQLNHDDLIALEGIGVVKARRLLQAIEQSKTASLERFIFGLGIPEVGKVRAMRIATTLHSLNDFTALHPQAVSDIAGLSKAARNNLLAFLAQAPNQTMLNQLNQALENGNIKHENIED